MTLNLLSFGQFCTKLDQMIVSSTAHAPNPRYARAISSTRSVHCGSLSQFLGSESTLIVLNLTATRSLVILLPQKVCVFLSMIGELPSLFLIKSADPASPWPRQGGAWDHRRCGTLLSFKATVNCTTASDLLWASKTDGCIAPPSIPHPCPSLMLRLAPSLVLWDFKTDGWPLVPISKASPGPKCCWSWL